MTAANLRRFLLVAALVVCPLLANAQSTATGSLTVGGMSSITITGNQQFVMNLGVTTNFPASGYTVFYQTGMNGSGLFQLISRVNTSPINPVTMGPVFDDPTTGDATAFSGTNGILMPSNARDLGYTGDQTNNQPMGTYSLQSITVNTLNAPVGTYTIFLDARTVMTDRTGGGFFDVPFGAGRPGSPVLTINVIPEPATVGLAIVGGALLLVVGWRKRARA